MAILSMWYVDFTLICMFMNWLIPFFILAGLYLIKTFYGVISNFINRKSSKSYPNFILIGDFVITILLTIFLIYKIPDATLQNIVTPIIAAVYGGVLTLVGVVLTIKHSERNLKLDNRLRNKPILIMVENHSIGGTSTLTNKSGDLIESEGEHANLGFIMKNIASMPCKLYGAQYTSRIVEFSDKHIWVESQEMVWIHMQFNDFKYGDPVTLIVEDIAGYRYGYLLESDNIGGIATVKEIEVEQEAK